MVNCKFIINKTLFYGYINVPNVGLYQKSYVNSLAVIVENVLKMEDTIRLNTIIIVKVINWLNE